MSEGVICAIHGRVIVTSKDGLTAECVDCSNERLAAEPYPQPQQSETTFEAWERRYFPPNGQPDKGQDVDRVDLQNCWNAALRSRQVAPEVVEQLADTIVRWFTTPNDERFFENGKTYVINRITETIAQAGKAGE